MDYDLLNTIIAVKKNLDLQLEDLAFERSGSAVELYYDNSDIHDAVLGARAFYPPFEDQFSRRKFDHKSTLVRSLVASGWFGKIRLLPPHQAEFLTQLRFYFGIDIPTDPKADAKDFLRDIDLENVGSLIDFPKDSKKEKVLAFVTQQAGLVERLFKAVQCMVPWHRRLSRWEARNMLEFETTKPRYDEIVENEHFIKLKQAFDRKRETTPVNNFADAVAITILVQRVKEFTGGKITTIPRFYVPTELFQEILDSTGVSEHLTYESPFGLRSTVLCDSDYYIYKAAFIPRTSRDADASAELDKVEEYLKDLRDKVANLLPLPEKLRAEELTRIRDLGGKPLNEIIRDLRQLSFLENVWLKFDAPHDIDEALLQIIEASKDLTQTEKFQEGVAKALKATEEKLDKNVEEFKWISSIWDQVEKSADELRHRVRVTSSTSDEFFRDLGLFRYGFPPETQEGIRNVLNEIIAGGEEEKAARISIISASYRGRSAPSRERGRLITASAIMLALRMYLELYSMLNKINVLPHRSLKVVFGEVLFRLKRKRDKWVNIVKELENEYQGEKNPTDSANLAIGISYLYFRLWRASGGKAPWRYHSEKADETRQALCTKYITRAISYAYAAYQRLGEHDLMKRVYALNQYLYYMVEQGNDERTKSIERAAGELTFYQTDPEIWHYRFDDTFSRYFHLLAVKAQTEEKWEELINESKRLGEEALKASYGDEDVQQHMKEILLTKSRGFTQSSTD